MALRNVFLVGCTVLATICLIDRVDGVNGPILPLRAADYPYLVMIKPAIKFGVQDSLPGMFIAKQYLISSNEILNDHQFNQTFIHYGSHDTLRSIVNPVRSWTDSRQKVIIYKVCRKHELQVMALTPSLYPTFQSNITGILLWYSANGTLFGHTVDILANANCPQAFIDSSQPAARFNATANSCTAIDRTSSCAFFTDLATYFQFPMLVVNGIVTGILDVMSCNFNTKLYSGTSSFFNIQYFRSFILSTVPSATP